jgi:NAD(P)-dependent dehydrogenase (short-subunit alcohol dehydrogenase family)
VEALVARGDRVAVLDTAEATFEAALWLQTDVSDESSVDRAFAAIDARLGVLDVLVNCAGIGAPLAIIETSLERWDRTMRVNATGVFLCTRAAAQRMIPRRAGAIVSVSSTNAYLGAAETAAYAASKGAVEAFTRAAAAELGEFGIRVNAVAPGAVPTPLWEDRLTPATRRTMSERSALGRMGTPSEIADGVAFLSSEESSFVTGIVLPICGGRSTTESLRLTR